MISKKPSINSKLYRLIGLTFLCMSVGICGSYYFFEKSKIRNAVDAEAQKLVQSSHSQVEILLPSLVVAEQSSSIDLILGQIESDDGLKKASLGRPENINPSDCKTYNSVWVCIQYFNGLIKTLTPIHLASQDEVYLLKEKQVPVSFGAYSGLNELLLPLALVLGLFVFLIFKISTFVKLQIRKPIDEITEVLAPSRSKQRPLRAYNPEVREVEVLFEKVQALVEDYERTRVRSAIADNARQVAHDIRSPVSALQLVVESSEEIPDFKRKVMVSAVQRISAIADELIKTSNANAAEPLTTDETRPIDLSETEVPTLIQRLKTLMGEKKFEYGSDAITWTLSSDFVEDNQRLPVETDEVLRVVSNLINNSFEAIPKDRKAKIDVALSDTAEHELTISISDNGVGIPEDIQSKVGTRGFSYNKEGQHRSGSGLGLFHARTTMEKIGGKLQLDSRPGQGTKVELHFPKA